MCSPLAFVFSLFTVSVVFSKAVHLYNHVGTISAAAFVFFLPTFVFLDFLAICIARVLLQQGRSALAIAGTVVGTILTLIVFGGASSQLGFYYKTGGELQWRDASSYATNKEGLKVLLTGSASVIAAGVMMFVVALALSFRSVLYNLFGNLLFATGNQVASALRWIGSKVPRARLPAMAPFRRTKYSTLEDADDSDDDLASEFSLESDPRTSSDPSVSASQNLLGATTAAKEDPASSGPGDNKDSRFCGTRLPTWAVKVAVATFLVIAIIVRPEQPYKYMSITLPVSMLDVFKGEPDFCDEQRELVDNDFPFPDLLAKKYWQEADGDYKGWAPGRNSPTAEAFRKAKVDWLPETLPRGFFRYDHERFEKGYYGSLSEPGERRPTCVGAAREYPYYSPVEDPLRITNLRDEILEPLRAPLADGSVKIKNVAIILMESLRQEFFPFQQGSEIHKVIMNTHGNHKHAKQEANDKLAYLTPHIEKITGRSGNFKDADGNEYEAPELVWNDTTAEGFGGVNVVGGYTASTMSTKSWSVAHCGHWPMAVEKFEEADTDSYQACIPQILDMFNRKKDDSNDVSPDDFQDQPWRTAMFESMVEEYDRQEKFDEKLGFQHKVTRKQIYNDWRFNESDPLFKKVNYFGFPEPVLVPHITEYITNATRDNERFFFSHFTSTTHHAWDTPEDWETFDYIPNKGMDKWHTDFNKYINTIRYHDAWMGQLMQLFEDLGVANETLVVFAGDHGQAFKEDYYKTGTYETGHVSDFRVPLVFRHPHLPRVQYNANATSLSIIPTILDLLVNSGSLNGNDTSAASDLVQAYEGQSLIRPYKASENGRRAWNFAVINSGAGMLAVTSADAPWRLVMPLDKTFEFTLTDLSTDPIELNPIAAWSHDEIKKAARKAYGKEAEKWVAEAVPIARWWRKEKKRLWRYHFTPKES